MPIYEFACNACAARVSVFVRSMSSPVAAKCGRCGGGDLRRLISRVAVIKASNSDEFAGLDDDSMMSGFDESDPKAMAAWARRMQRESGEEMGPEFEEMVERLERLERGESPDSLDEGLGGDDFGDDDFGDL
jgi:putative FmdB family regulatory protein